MWPFRKRERLPLLRLKKHVADRLFVLKCNTLRICDACAYEVWNMNAYDTEPKVVEHLGCPAATMTQNLRASQVAFESKWSYCLG